MASAAALKHLLQQATGIEAVIAASGDLGRAENRAALQFLGETLEDIEALDLASFDLHALVDTQPGFGNNSWPPDVPVDIIIDHHPRGPGIGPRHFADIRPHYGATSTILTEYLRAARIQPDTPLATALFYGIRTDTQDLGRCASPADTEAFLYLYPIANHRLLAKIEREPLPRAYFATLTRALLACRLCDTVAILALGEVGQPDILAEMADFFLRIEGIRWTLCHGAVDRKLHLSLRTVLHQANAGQLMVSLLAGLGTGGGHEMMAGGQVPLATDDPEALAALIRDIERRFLKLLGVSARAQERLVPTPP
jgi:nanoRNase/pAp phosphatase (c-di-AMP/oligoRNAs hydrolase)